MRTNKTIEERLQHQSLGIGEHMIWCGTLSRRGYGKLSVGGKAIPAHRLAWLVEYGPIPAGLLVLHLCPGEPHACIRAEHLYLGTHADNAKDRDRAGHNRESNKTQCPRGHPYDEANTYNLPSGDRVCLTCRRFRDRARSPRLAGSRKPQGAPLDPNLWPPMSPQTGSGE